ncbi:hypothetical protein CDL15_Pgr010523 [Punica granatum]|uniref:FAE domain-containing protein n=1 Tax=Punica granatum TaxID=22663 RepID=A0A218XX67_PUNGR|nr:hypothetical protein CDL15_Pgr010523 [Punica granatum]
MARPQQESFSTEIVNRAVIEDPGPYAGSLSFTVLVRRKLPDFLRSVNLTYVKLGYHYLIGNGFYFLIVPVLGLVLFAEAGKVVKWRDFSTLECSLIDLVFIVEFLGLILHAYLVLNPPPTYPVDFLCYRPPNELKISREEYIELPRESGSFTAEAIEFQKRVLKRSGLGDETRLPKYIF